MEPENPISVRHAPDDHCYELLDGDTVIGKTEYVPSSDPANRERIFYHTEVGDAYTGKGVASVLVKHALNDTIAAGLTIIPVCPYVKAWIRSHAEYQQRAGAVRPEHLAAVDQIQS